MKKAITQQIQLQHGKPVIAGTRVPVDVILGSLAGGMSYNEVISEYGIDQDGILACLSYASQLLQQDTVYSLADYPLSDAG